MLGGIERWSKWRLVATFWAVQVVAVLLAHMIWAAWYPIQFKRPLEAELVEGLGQVTRLLSDPDIYIWTAIVTAVVTVLQVLILLPLRRPAPIGMRGPGGRSMWTSLAVCGLLCGLLWGGAVMAVLDVLWLADGFDWSKDAGGAWLLLAGPLSGWLVATPLLVRFASRSRRETYLATIASRLLTGTAIEVLAITPLDVMVRRKSDCYCDRGTFWTFIACGTVGFAALGPAIFIPLLARRRQRWYAGHCAACGYDMSGRLEALRCPECGAGWRPSDRDAAAHEPPMLTTDQQPPAK